jgi:hypothetical protein
LVAEVLVVLETKVVEAVVEKFSTQPVQSSRHLVQLEQSQLVPAVQHLRRLQIRKDIQVQARVMLE